MRRSRRRRMWLGAAELALALKAYGPGGGAVSAAMVQAAERALAGSRTEEKEVYRLEFVEGMNGKMACAHCHISERTYYRRRARLIESVAEEMRNG